MNLVGLVKTIFIILIIYYGSKFVGRYLLRGFVSKAANEARRQQDQVQNQQKKKKEGEVTVNYKPKSNKAYQKEEGDYIDFEEIK